MSSGNVDRRKVILGGAAMITSTGFAPPAAATDPWLPVAPADAGFAPDLEDRLDKAIAAGRIWNLHGLVALRNDRLALERYFAGEDRARGIGDIGRVVFRRGYAARSAVVFEEHHRPAVRRRAAREGAAAEDAPLFAAFPEYADLAPKRGRERLTVEHALTMTMGTDWDESSLAYADPQQQRDRDGQCVRSLSLYPGAAGLASARCALDLLRRTTALLAHMIARIGRDAARIRPQEPVRPLGMGTTEWATGPERRAVRGLGRADVVHAISHGSEHDVARRKIGARTVIPGGWVERWRHARHQRR